MIPLNKNFVQNYYNGVGSLGLNLVFSALRTSTSEINKAVDKFNSKDLNSILKLHLILFIIEGTGIIYKCIIQVCHYVHGSGTICK